MTTSLKDVSSAEMIRKLAEMNCFEQECTMYGYAWKLDNGMRMYSMSEDELFIQQAFENHMTCLLYTSDTCTICMLEMTIQIRCDKNILCPSK